MGHWSALIADDVAATLKAKLGRDPDPEVLRSALAQATGEIETLTGRLWTRSEQATAQIDSGGFPLAEIPDFQRDTLHSESEVHAIPDPIHPHMSTVLQIAAISEPAPAAIPTSDALWVGGQLIVQAARNAMLSEDYLIRWLGAIERSERERLLRRVMDPAYIQHVPILGIALGGWWFQITRRLVWVTSETPTDGGRLVQPLMSDAQPPVPLVGVEPVLIIARLTTQPIEWAMTVRIWTDEVPMTATGRPWSPIAKAIRGYGIPIMRIDDASSPEETACQLVLLGHWHGYVDKKEPGLAQAVVRAFPRQVERVRSGTGALDAESAAAVLLEGLLYPGFDPARGAEANRRYVTRKASIAVMEHRKAESPVHPWDKVGVSERRYYKLLPRFASKVGGRFEVDRQVIAKIRAHLDRRDELRTVRSAAMDVLRERGFRDAAARKWLQRHRPEEALHARPRGSPR